MPSSPTRQIGKSTYTTRVKREDSIPQLKIESEDSEIWDLTLDSPIRTRISRDNDRDIIEIFSSDDDMDDEETDPGFLTEAETDSSYRAMSEGGLDVEELEDDSEEMGVPTDWNDPEVLSRIIYNGKLMPVTRQLAVEGVEILDCIPSLWPIPRVPTAFIVDLRDPKFRLVEKGKLLTVDGLIKNKVLYNPVSCFTNAKICTYLLGSGFLVRRHRTGRYECKHFTVSAAAQIRCGTNSVSKITFEMRRLPCMFIT